MAYLKASVKNGLETPSERFLRRFLDQMTQQLYLLPPLFSLSSGSGVAGWGVWRDGCATGCFLLHPGLASVVYPLI